MDAKSIVTLELPVILDRLASHAAFSASKELARALKPTDDLEDVRRRLAETTEARTLLSLVPGLTIGGAHDMRSAVAAATRGVILEPNQLLDLKSTLIASRTLRRRFDKTGESFPVLAILALGLEPSSELIETISKTLDERGEVLDSASERLATIRHDLRVSHDRLTGKLQRLLNDPKISPMLQEPIITQRDGRFVIPLRAEFKGRVKSVIHDQSASGATLFIEPLTVVDLNNELRELQLAERDEVRRILAELSAQVGRESEAIIRTVEALAKLDLAFAKARYAEAMKANEPIMNPYKPRADANHPGSTLRLLSARHPLLDPENVVPIDLVLGADTYALVITGPNTGGKTVSLKTAGLLSLMAQCGLHVPALSGSELSTFDSVYADIGDEQSIEQSLSTFSSHISTIIDILKHATSRSLVVLDELGAGTDPQEGAALARAILGVLLERRVTTLVATHYPELKTYAHVTTGVRNASVEFDLESLRPTYHLTIGLPGRSNALAIAGRLGLDEDIVQRARKMVSPEDLRAESLLDEIHRQRDLTRQDREESEQARKQVQALETELAKRLEAIDDERLELLEQARADVEAEVDGIREQLRELRRRLARAGQPLETLKEIESELEELEDQVADSVSHPTWGLDPSLRSVDSMEEAFRLGDRVRLRTIDAEGVITDLNQEQAEVQVGRLRVRARLDELMPSGEDPSTEHRRFDTHAHVVIPQAPPLELNLRGRTVEEGLEELERRLDAAYLAGMPFIRVIHGKGTGRLREAIRQALRDNPYVSSFEPGKAGEGGDGVTVVRLAIS
ncbi:MAG TPA: endonuclease MutS2 [Anaerolineae bacterium]|nr:endonuclease MutS2 [Anaerolineae bacterium]